MAGIEKVCEYSGEYPGGNMYAYKRNQLQIMPEYRKLFRGVDHTLHIFKPEAHWVFKNFATALDYSEMNDWEPGFKDKPEYIQFMLGQGNRIGYEHFYVLEVPSLPGQVKGMYLNWTFELPTVKRKLTRLVRRRLNIVQHDCSHGDWDKDDT